MLSVKNLSAAYGSIPVLNDVTLDVRQGEVLALMGRNGVGKTTLMRTLAGQVPATQGEVLFKETNIVNWPSYRIAKQGVALVPQGRGIFPKLTVLENLTIGTRASRSGQGIPETVYDYFPILAERKDQLGGTLSGGQQQQLAIARALCGSPSLILLDEPSEGIQPNIVHQIGLFLRRLVMETGLSVLLVEQNLDLAVTAADRCLIMEKGRIIHEGTADDLHNEEMLSQFLAV